MIQYSQKINNYFDDITNITFNYIININLGNFKMKTLKKKYLNVTCNRPIRNQVDMFLKGEYDLWKEKIRNEKTRGVWTCGEKGVTNPEVSDHQAVTKNNQMLKQYIKYIYQEYEIQDPLIEQKRQANAQKPYPLQPQIHLHSNRRQPVNLVESRYVRAFEEPRRYTDVTPIKYQNQRIKKPENIRTHNTEQSHFRSNSQFSSHYNRSIEIDTSRHLAQNKSTYIKPQSTLYKSIYDRSIQSRRLNSRIAEQEEYKQKNNSSFFNISGNMTEIPVKQSFRYCLSCEAAILSCNIREHQRVCLGYNDLFDKNISQLISYIQLKITKINLRIQQIFKSQKINSTDVSQLQQHSLQFSKESMQAVKTGLITNRFLSNYNNMIKIGQNYASLCEEVNKVRWFIKVRETIKKDYQI